MIFRHEYCVGTAYFVTAIGRLKDSNSLQPLRTVVERVRQMGGDQIVLNFEGVSSSSNVGVAALVDLISYDFPDLMCVYGLVDRVRRKIERFALLDILPIYRTYKDVFSLPGVRHAVLRNTPAVLIDRSYADDTFSGGKRQHILTLDAFGKPLISRSLDYYSEQGFSHFHILSNELSLDTLLTFDPQISAIRDMQFYAQEFAGSQIPRNKDGFLIANLDCLVDAEYAYNFAIHKASETEVTHMVSADVEESSSPDYAIPQKRQSTAQCLYLSPGSFNAIVSGNNLTNSDFVFGRASSFHHSVTRVCPKKPFLNISDKEDYLEFLSQLLNDRFSTVSVDAIELTPGVWASPTSFIHKNAVLKAPCYIGSQAEIGENSIVGQFSVIGSGSIVMNDAGLFQSAVQPNARVEEGSLLESTVFHRFGEQSIERLSVWNNFENCSSDSSRDPTHVEFPSTREAV